jgi:hypothetical protein
MLSHIEVGAMFEIGRSLQDMEQPDPALEMEGKKAVEPAAFARTSLRSFSEYVFDNWDRVAGGPSYDFDLGAVGGFISYLMVFDHLHLSVGFQTRNLTDFRIAADDAYFPTAAIYWRW